MRIGLLGNTQAQAARLTDILPFEHDLVMLPPADRENGPTFDVDAVLTPRFDAADAARIRCKLLQVSGVGLDGIAMEAVPPGTWICNVHGHGLPIAEYAMLAVLESRIGFDRLAKDFSNEGWGNAFRTRVPHGEVAGLTLGLVGFGHIGQALAPRAKAFGMRVMAVTASGRGIPDIDWSAGTAHLDALIEASDFIVLACPLTEATRGLIDARRLGLMKRSAILINVARGEVVDEAALFDSLSKVEIGGAVLDTWYAYPTATNPEPRPSRYRFDQLPNVRCTPHVSAWTEGLMARRYRAMADNLARLRSGEPLLDVVRPGGGAPPAEGATHDQA